MPGFSKLRRPLRINTMKIRKIKRSETDFLGDMLYEAIFIPEGHEALPIAIIKDKALSKYIDHWGKDKYDIALVAEADKRLVGAVWGRRFTTENKGFGYVDAHTPELSMAVRAAFRNKGVGTALLEAIASEYRKIGVGYLSLSVDKANKAADLYKRLGYEIAGETKTSWTLKKRIL